MPSTRLVLPLLAAGLGASLIATGASLSAASADAGRMLSPAASKAAYNGGHPDVVAASASDDTVLGTFSALGSGLGSTVNAIAVSENGTVYAGGAFTDAGGNPDGDRIAAWSNADDTWHALGRGVNSTVSAVALLGDDTVYAGGTFTDAGGNPDADRIAAWSNADDTWHALGRGVSSTVFAVALLGDDTVYAGGTFTDAGGNPDADRIAAWSNADDTWHALGTGVPNRVTSLAVPGDDTVYAGGAFTDAGGNPNADRIAAWSNADDTWHALGTGANQSVESVAASSDDSAFVGGSFTSAGGIPGTNMIGAWSGRDSAWRSLGGGMNGVNRYVYALAVDDTHGLVYAGGDFGGAGGVAGTNRVAVWDAGLAEWIALQAAGGTGTNDDVRALAVDDSVLYLGGDFTTAAGVTVNRIARWAWDPPRGANASVSAPGETISLSGTGFIGVPSAGGVYIGGVPSPSYVRDDSISLRNVVIPAGAYGTVPVEVDAVGGRASVGTVTLPGPPAPPPIPSSPPTSVSAVAGDASADVAWAPPESSGSFAVSNYLVTASPGGRTCLTSLLICRVAGLTNGTTYTFTVAALTGAGWSQPSDPSNAVTPRRAPDEVSITITGSRSGPTIAVDGTTTGLAIGGIVRPWAKKGSGSFTSGRDVLVSADGSFTWSRTATPARTWSVYFTAEGARSNVVVLRR